MEMSDEKTIEGTLDELAEYNAGYYAREAVASRAHADAVEPSRPDLAKRYREAAHRQDESAAILRGERTFATDAELAETRVVMPVAELEGIYLAGDKGVDRG